MARIDASEDGTGFPTLSSILDRARSLLGGTHPIVRGVMAAQAALLLLLVGVLLLQIPSSSQSFYKTASTRVDVSDLSAMRLRLVFSEDMAEKQIRSLLQEIGGQIIAGPSPQGVYTVAVPVAADTENNGDFLVDQLRANQYVRFVQMVRRSHAGRN